MIEGPRIDILKFVAKPDVPKQLNICIVATKFPILGRAEGHGFIWSIARALAQKNHNVTVIAWKNPLGKKEIVQDGVQAFFLGESFARSARDFPYMAKQKFEQLHEKNKFHLVHSIDSSGLQIGLNKKKYKIAMTYDVESMELSKLISVFATAPENPTAQIRAAVRIAIGFLRTYFKKDRKIRVSADGIFVTSPQQKALLERHYFFPDMKTFIVPYGLELSDLTAKEKSLELSTRLGLPENAKTVVTVSDMQELVEIKNLLRAFEKTAVKKPNARLIIVGSGPFFKQIEFEMLNLALGSRVIFTGDIATSDLPEYICLADVYVDLSSRSSGFEPSMIEAMAQKKVIVGSELSPISTLVEDGVEGFLIRPADITGLADLLLGIFNDHIPTANIGQNAHKKVMSLFTTEKMVNLTLDAYRHSLEVTGFYRSKWAIFS